jgi:hypothetical protein
MKFRRILLLKSLAVTRRKAPKLAKRIAKSTVLSSAAEVFLHHKLPDGSLVIDVTVIESVDSCLKMISHLL